MPFECPVGCPADCCYFKSEEENPTAFYDEVLRLRREAEKRGLSLEFKELGEINGARIYRWIIRGWCPFFDKISRRCTIHQEKPLACRMFPLVLDVKNGNVYLSENCLWVRENGPHPLDDFPNEKKALSKVVSRLKLVR
ncbi:MAG: YkgJ family cysteine cluster protein [Thermoproteus sp.]|nr:YkgJ family cysteine cluster protein [Thermoproteus sp.]